MVTHGSSPCHAGRDVIVPTSDFLTTLRGGGAAAQTPGAVTPAAQQSSATHHAGEAAAETQVPDLLSADLPGLPTPAGVHDKRSDEGSGGSDSRPESPVSLWISPQQHPLFAAHSTRHEPSEVQLAIAELVDSIVAQVDSQSSLLTEPETSGGAHEMEQSNSFQFEAAHPANDEQYPDRWPLGRVSIDKTSATRAEYVPSYACVLCACRTFACACKFLAPSCAACSDQPARCACFSARILVTHGARSLCCLLCRRITGFRFDVANRSKG